MPLLSEITNGIKNAIMVYEKRIKDLQVIVDIDKDNESKLILNIKYKIEKNNLEGNLVFPFYLQEGVEDSNV